MGEWSDYFEDFPQEDPGNYDERGRYDPDRRLRAEAERQRLAHRKLDEALRLKPWSSGKTEKIGR